MKHIYIKITICVLLSAFFNFSFAQQRRCNDGGYLVVPDVLSMYCKASEIQKIQSGQISLASLPATNSNCWEVYSDRNNNALYKDANWSNKIKNDALNFMEPLAVKEISGEWLQVYSKIYDDGRGKIETHKYRGWVHVSQLIISSYALLNDIALPKKAMALISLDSVNASSLQELRKEGVEKYRFYFGPDLSDVKGESDKFEIYYVIKEVNNGKLLSRTDKLTGTGNDLRNNVPGWMSNFHTTRWDHRVCLEQSNFPDAVTQYSGQKIPVFPTPADLDHFVSKRVQNTDEAIMRFDLTAQRPVAIFMRMPVLQNISSQIKKVATVGTLEIDKEQTIKEQAKLKETLVALTSRLENINILFVIDGTQSMEKYYPSIAASVSGIINNNKLFGTEYNLKFGVVIYRDYEDGENACEVLPLTANYQAVTNKISSTVCYSKDKDLPEAQYNGLIEGIEKAHFDTSQSNIVVLIGDAGNSQPDKKGKTLQQVINILDKYNINLITFQVFQGRDETFSVFNADAQDFLTGTAQKKLDAYSKKTGVKVNVKLQSLAINNTYKLDFVSEGINESLSDFLTFGRFTYASDIKQMDTTILRKNIQSSVFENIQSINSAIADMGQVISGSTDKAFAGKYEDAIKKIICAKFQLSNQECELFLKNVNDFSFVGFTSLRFNSKTADCYMPVVFLSKDEFGKLKTTFNSFERSVSGADKVNALKRALTEQCLTTLGEKSEEVVLQKTLNEIWQILLAVPFDSKGTYGNLGDTKLRDINTVEKKTLDRFMINFSNSIKGFSEGVFKERYFKIARQIYSWFPLNEFPGNE